MSHPIATTISPVLIILTAALVMAAPIALVACGDEQPSAPSGSPSITGPVKSAAANGDGAVASFLIDQGSGDYDKAHVNVAGDTAWYRRSSGVVQSIEVPRATSLAGTRVEVQFTGAIADSYPVQATAGWVIVAE